MRALGHGLVGALATAALSSGTAQAFLQTESDDLSLELRGNLRINQTLGRNPAVDGLSETLAPDRELSASFGLLRLIGEAYLGDSLALELHVFGAVSAAGASSLSGLADGFGATDAGRAGALSWRPYQRNGTLGEVALDRAAVKLFLPFGQVSVGRQPINLATTYYFTPNDLFQAFSAQTFFRVYKPGVDAARIDVELGELSQLNVFGVLGYADEDPDTRLEAPDGDASSLLLRLNANWGGFEWAALGGKAPFFWMAGVGIQGELWDWLGVRIEGHLALPLQEDLRDRVELAVGLEHRFESSLDVRIEYFYNGSGERDPDGYGRVLEDPVALVGVPYLGRHYAALGASYDLSALWTVDGFGLVNLSDGSFQVATAFAYSLLDDVDLATVVSVPVGSSPSATFTAPPPAVALELGSELGAAPIAVSAELRAFF